MDEKNISNSVVNNENLQQTQQTKLDASEPQITDECLLCSEQKRDTVFKPCGHVIACEACGSRIKKCLICRETVSSREKVSRMWISLENLKFISNVPQIDECIVCSDRKASIFFKPCGHMVACDHCAPIMKKCVQCRSAIEQMIPFRVCCGQNGTIAKVSHNLDENKKDSLILQGTNHNGHNINMNNCNSNNKFGVMATPSSSSTAQSTYNNLSSLTGIHNNNLVLNSNLSAPNNANNSTSSAASTAAAAVAKPEPEYNVNLFDDMQKLQQQLQDIKEQTMCPVCFDRIKNMVFLCGHGVCQYCGDQIEGCPICRKTVEKRILLF